jgi:FemAB-related protein (PEP-CTERM system-associated)
MAIKVQSLSVASAQDWDRYVRANGHATAYHLSGWSRVIEKTYGHKTYLMAAIRENAENQPNRRDNLDIVGILPIVKMRDIMLSTSLISMPFCDFGGAIANDHVICRLLIENAISVAGRLGAKRIEFRNAEKTEDGENLDVRKYGKDLHWIEESRRCRLILKLPESSGELMKGFKSKLRSQIKRPSKSGCKARVGKSALIEDFYSVFASNMRDLGSPVHSKRLFENILNEFYDITTIFIVFKDDVPLAGSITIGFGDTMYNPWASSLRQYSRLSPNMLLYWKMLEFASNNGYKIFDFGRSYVNEGTYRFKKQWGAQPVPLPWQHISNEKKRSFNVSSDRPAFQAAAEFWKKLPLTLTKIIGPRLRKHIGL